MFKAYTYELNATHAFVIVVKGKNILKKTLD